MEIHKRDFRIQENSFFGYSIQLRLRKENTVLARCMVRHTLILDEFQDLFHMMQNTGDTDAQCMAKNWWEEKLRRILKDSQTGSITELIEKLDKYSHLSNKPDCLCWKVGEKGLSQSNLVICQFRPGRDRMVSFIRGEPESHGSTYGRSTPLKARFIWAALRSGCLTQANLQKRELILRNRCY